MSNNCLEILIPDDIVLVVRAKKLINVARKQHQKNLREEALEDGFEVVEHPVIRKQQKAKALMSEKKLREKKDAEFVQDFTIAIFFVLICLAFFYCFC
ncbi:hypothetical protein CAEBREN_04155 [Caenorhabditis brenneri]|uniref:Uncharacterized protein n=1 Tax=Caenorhabditis brenneri TaxID=135651 RepID=G0MMV2_CAEBE|nr:hypothetical protein CAEBREN_04155 [Caenorhabditis brenneri]